MSREPVVGNVSAPGDQVDAQPEHGETPQVSIVMLARNQSRYLLTAAGSVLEHPQAELILVEPGSDDGSRAIVEALGRLFPARVKVITAPDGGPAEGLNNGFHKATGVIRGFLNGDDVLLPGALDHVLHWFESHEAADVLLGSGLIADQDSGAVRFSASRSMGKYVFALGALGGSTLFQQGMFWRADRLASIKFNPSNPVCWDAEFLRDAIISCATIGSSNRGLAIFRVNSETITGSGRLAALHKDWRSAAAKQLLGRRFWPHDYLVAALLRLGKKLRGLLRVT